MSKLITNTIRHTGGSADNITLDNSQNVTFEADAVVDGRVNIGSTGGFDSNGDDLTITNASHGGITIKTGTSSDGIIRFGDGSGAAEYRGYINYKHADDDLVFGTGANERLRILSNGNMVQRYSADPYDNRALTLQSPAGDTGTFLALVNTETNGACGIVFGDHVGQNVGNYTGYIHYSHANDEMKFLTNGGNERFKVGSSGDVTITDGNLVVASGHGIDFSATSGTGTSELLDDYEEGTWTPADASGQSISYTDTAGNCTYTKIGRTVVANFGVTFLSTSNAHEAKIGGLPFTCINTTSSNAAVAVSEHTDDQSTTMIVVENQSYIVILHCHNGVDARTNAECSGKNYRGTVVYQID